MGLSKKVREHVARQSNWRCSKCKLFIRYYYQVDHIRPQWAGGSDQLSNLQLLCGTCHDIKSRRETTQRARVRQLECSTILKSERVCWACGVIHSRYFAPHCT